MTQRAAELFGQRVDAMHRLNRLCSAVVEAAREVAALPRDERRLERLRRCVREMDAARKALDGGER